MIVTKNLQAQFVASIFYTTALWTVKVAFCSKPKQAGNLTKSRLHFFAFLEACSTRLPESKRFSFRRLSYTQSLRFALQSLGIWPGAARYRTTGKLNLEAHDEHEVYTNHRAPNPEVYAKCAPAGSATWVLVAALVNIINDVIGCSTCF